jgi:hypothetical protein
MSQHHIVLGDCIEYMQTMPDNSVDAIVCDPPYGLGFMGKDWDNAAALHRPPSAEAGDTPLARFRTGKGPSAVTFDGPAFQAWCQQWATEALRVLKPGGYMLAAGGSRTFHRLTTGIEDAGCGCPRNAGHRCKPAWVHPSEWDDTPGTLENGVLSQIRTAPSAEAPGAADRPDATWKDTVESTEPRPVSNPNTRTYPDAWWLGGGL